MSDRFFLDTNIFIHSFDTAAPAKKVLAERLIRKALATHKGVVSYQVVQEFFNVALRRFARPLGWSEAEQYLGSVFRPMLAVHTSQALYAEALHIHFTSGLSWYDCLIVGSAMQAECKVLYTEDLQHGQKFGSLQVVNPYL